VSVAPALELPLAGALVPPYASWGRRVVAALLDGAVLTGATWLVLGSGSEAPSLTPVPPGLPVAEGVSWVSSPILVALVVVLLALQGYTGATPGKRVVGIAVVRASTGRPVGLVTSALRVVAHLLDAILLIGYLRPLWDAKCRTFADSMVGTLVLQTRDAPLHPWFARLARPTRAGSALATAGSVAVCALGVGFSTTTTSTGWMGTALVPCSAQTGLDVATATASRDGSWSQERRLWVTRPAAQQDEAQLSITWHWEGPAGDVAAPTVIRTDLLDASGVVVTTANQEVGQWPSADGPVRLGPATYSTSDLAHAGQGWTVRSAVDVGGRTVASCTVRAEDWSATS
jgi:Mce-associated membrane protein